MRSNAKWWLVGLGVPATVALLAKLAALGAPAPPRLFQIAAGESQDIPSQSYLHYDFELEGRCALTGRIVGVAGGSKDFQAFLVSEEDYQNWLASRDAQVYWQTGQVAAATIDARVSGSGTYHLVVNNGFSRLTAKTVTVEAQAECR